MFERLYVLYILFGKKQINMNNGHQEDRVGLFSFPTDLNLHFPSPSRHNLSLSQRVKTFMFIIDRWVDNRRPEVPMENGRPCSDHEGSSLAQVSQPYLPLSKCNLGSSVITRFNTKHSFRFTLEKYVSDYCNIKTNTGTIQNCLCFQKLFKI